MKRKLLACVTVLAALAGLARAAEPLSVGDGQLPEFELIDFRGRTWKLEDLGEHHEHSVLAVAFLGTECPLAKLYAVRLADLQEMYGGKGVQIMAVMSNRQDSLEEIASFANRQQLPYPVLKDPGNRFADQLGASRTPEIFLFDEAGLLRYRGRVDDQYGIGYVRDEPRRRDLELAIQELLQGSEISVAETKGVGCIIGRQKPIDAASNVTYGGQVAEILARRCVECHRDGEIAPFSLTDYQEVAGWADMIAETVDSGRMPPWHATSEHAAFANDRSMSTEEKEILMRWADAGAPAGDLSNLPQLPEDVRGWQLDEQPDLVIPVSPEPFDVPATGAVRYQYFRFDPQFDEDVWVKSMELRPGNREVVHHILVFARPKGTSGGVGGARGFLAGYVPGARLETKPKGYAKRIPAGSELVFQVHYTPVGTPQADQSQFGIVFADAKEITHEIVTTSALQTRFEIPPGEPSHEVFATGPTFPPDAELLSFSPHMHVRGKSFRYDLQSPDGTRRRLLDIPDYDFNWQTTYVLAEPLAVEPGSRIVCRATFDNSLKNLNNPDPTSTVRWGDQTWDEMMIGYYHYAVPLKKAEAADAPPTATDEDRNAGPAIRNSRLRRFNQLDGDGDGKLLRRDVPPALRNLFRRLDGDRNGVLTREEVAADS